MSEIFRITESELMENSVESQPDHVSGEPDEVQRIFDRMPRFIAGRYNMFVEYVMQALKKYYQKDEVDELFETKLAEIGAGEAGPQGEKGDRGTDGVGVQSVEQTVVAAEDGGENVMTVTLTDGTVSAFAVKNGSRGSDGLKGEKGADGAKGDKGDKGDTGAQGPKGDKGDTGAKGADGKDGVSVTHLWNGTTLNVTSASGTSSVDLKGEKGADGAKGDKGDEGPQGAKGNDGFSPAVSVSKTDRTTRITIVDSKGTHVAEIKDGVDGSGAQSNWEENDETSANYVHNRTHWLEKRGVDAVIFAKTAISFSTGSAMVNGFVTGGVVEGCRYKVTWARKEYDCECYLADGMPTIGNGALAGGTESRDYPFCISSMGGTSCFVYKDTDAAETISLMVESVASKTYHKLDKNYLPDGVGGGAYVDIENTELFPETTLECNENGEGAIFQPIGLKEGETYTVVWNGTEYECVAADLKTVLGVPCVAVGDWKLMVTEGAETTGEPFLIAELSPEAAAEMGANATLMALDGSTAPALRILDNKKVCSKMDIECIPEGVPYFKAAKTEIFKGTLNFTEGQSILEGYILPIRAGETYRVSWNGTEYDLLAENFSGGFIAMGDGEVIGKLPRYTYPDFYIQVNEGGTAIMTNEEITTAEVTIWHLDIKKQEIDKRCMPVFDEIYIRDLVNGYNPYRLTIQNGQIVLTVM